MMVPTDIWSCSCSPLSPSNTATQTRSDVTAVGAPRALMLCRLLCDLSNLFFSLLHLTAWCTWLKTRVQDYISVSNHISGEIILRTRRKRWDILEKNLKKSPRFHLASLTPMYIFILFYLLFPNGSVVQEMTAVCLADVELWCHTCRMT